MKISLYKIFSVTFILASCLFITSCSKEITPIDSKTQKLTEKIGKENLDLIITSQKATVLRVEHNKKEGFSFKETSKISSEKLKNLKKLLLDDENYIFDKTKSCLFIPSAGWKVEGKENLIVLYSAYCKQIKIMSTKENMILDVDPSAEAFKEISE